MRVTAGRLRGHRLDAPRGSRVRPTYDRVRVSVFAVLGPAVEGAAVLDLFAGSGALAIESLSRGADRATLVEKDPGVIRIAARNVDRLGLSGLCDLRRCDALGFVVRNVAGGGFDLVFVDPPYDSELQEPTLELLSVWSGLRPGGIVVLERAAGKPVAASYGRLVRSRTKKYGSTEVDIYESLNETGAC
jgi:16S rRNA (guanine966-N2)-methyltransferase